MGWVGKEKAGRRNTDLVDEFLQGEEFKAEDDVVFFNASRAPPSDTFYSFCEERHQLVILPMSLMIVSMQACHECASAICTFTM